MKPPDWRIPLDDVASRILGSGLGDVGPMPEATEWSVDDWLIGRHRLQGLLVHAVASQHLSSTVEQRREVARLEVDLTRNRMWHDLRLIEITGLLGAAGIDQRVLKGPAFGTLDYPDRIMRPTGDIDLLVQGDDLAGAVETLVSHGGSVVDLEPVEGYARVIGKSTTVTMPDGLEVDLHRTLARGPFGVRMRPEDLWRRSREFTIGGMTMRTIGLEESLLHASYHLMVLSDRRALSVRDVAQFLADPALDATTVTEMAASWNAQIVLASAVLLTTSMIPAVAESPLLDWSRNLRPGPLDRTYLRIARPGDTMGPAEWPATFIALRSNRARLMLVRSILRPIEGSNPPFLSRIGQLARRSARRVRASWFSPANSVRRGRPLRPRPRSMQKSS